MYVHMLHPSRTGQQYDYYVAVALSLFLGMLGIDRFYLGYPAIGESSQHNAPLINGYCTVYTYILEQ